MKLKSLSLLFLTIFFTSCSGLDKTEQNEEKSWNLSDGVEFPENRPLSRAEDGGMD